MSRNFDDMWERLKFLEAAIRDQENVLNVIKNMPAELNAEYNAALSKLYIGLSPDDREKNQKILEATKKDREDLDAQFNDKLKKLKLFEESCKLLISYFKDEENHTNNLLDKKDLGTELTQHILSAIQKLHKYQEAEWIKIQTLDKIICADFIIRTTAPVIGKASQTPQTTLSKSPSPSAISSPSTSTSASPASSNNTSPVNSNRGLHTSATESKESLRTSPAQENAKGYRPMETARSEQIRQSKQQPKIPSNEKKPTGPKI